MATIRAAVFRAPHQPLEIESVEIDDPRDGEVLVRTVATGVCHSDLHFVDGDMELARFTPSPVSVLGHEGAGVVEAVGPGVSYVAPGDHVVACLSSFCGECDQCLGGHPNRCRTFLFGQRESPPRLTAAGASAWPFVGIGSYAEKMLLSERALVKVDPDIPLERAAVMGCGVLTGVGAALNTARVSSGSSVAVVGCGGVGLSIIAGAHLAGASTIIGVDQFAGKRDMVLAANGTHFVDASEVDPVASVRELTSGLGVDYAFDAVGRPELVRLALEMTGVGGTTTIVGILPMGATLEFPYALLSGEKRLATCTMGSNRFRTDIPRYLEFYRQGRLALDDLISRTLRLDDINEAFRAMKAGEVARQVIVFD